MYTLEKTCWGSGLYWTSWSNSTSGIHAVSAPAWLPWMVWCSCNVRLQQHCFSSLPLVASSALKMLCYRLNLPISLLFHFLIRYERRMTTLEARWWGLKTSFWRLHFLKWNCQFSSSAAFFSHDAYYQFSPPDRLSRLRHIKIKKHRLVLLVSKHFFSPNAMALIAIYIAEGTSTSTTNDVL